MSRSYKKEKGSGYEYWGKRANGSGKWHTEPGIETKRITAREERRKRKMRTVNIDSED